MGIFGRGFVGRVVAGGEGREGVLRRLPTQVCYMPSTPSRGRYAHSLGFNHWYLYSSPALAGGMLYVGSTQGKLVAIDLARFQTAWSFETEAMKERGTTLYESGWHAE